MKKFFFTIAVTLFTLINSFAQSTETVDMADKFRADGKIYVVVAVAAIILAGIFTYLIMLDRKISKLEKEIKE